jgi:Uma2 family endonuclease
MSAALQERMSLAAFLEWERGQELRYEFDGVGAVAMNGGTLLHSRIAFNAAVALTNKLAGTGCVVFNKDAKIEVDGRIRYPDVLVTCSGFSVAAEIAPDPVVVIEVLSPSTAGVDRIQKNAEYAATPSIQHYVMLEQSRRAATVFTRAGADWAGHLVLGDGVLHLPAIGVEMTLAEVYGGLTLPEADD